MEKDYKKFDEKFVLRTTIILMAVFLLGIVLAMFQPVTLEEKDVPMPALQRTTRYAP